MIKKKIKMPLYGFEYYLFYGTEAELNEWFTEINVEQHVIDNDYGQFLRTDKGHSIIILNSKHLPSSKYEKTLVHECVHLSTEVMRWLGLPINYDNDEILAHFTAHFYEKTIGIIKKERQ